MTSIDEMCGIQESPYTETQREIVEKFLGLLTNMTRECGVEIVDSGGFIFRMIDGKPFLTVSRDFLRDLGNHAIVLSMEGPATSDCVAVLTQSVEDVVKIIQQGDNYSASSTPELINRQPLYIQQLMRRKTLNNTEYSTLSTYLNTHSIRVTLEELPLSKPVETPVTKTVEKSVSKPVKRSVDIVSSVAGDSSRTDPLRSKGDFSEKPISKPVSKISENSGSDAEDSEVNSPVKQPRVQIPSEDDEVQEETQKDTEPVTNPEPKSQKLNVVFFKKNADGSKDRTVCKSGKYVYRLVKGKDKTELTGLGVYDAKTNGYTPLTKEDKAEIVKLGFRV